MSEKNVEIVRRGYEAFNCGDTEEMVADFAPTFEYVGIGAVPGFPAAYQGPKGWQKAVRWLQDEFEDARVEIHGLVGTGDMVLASLTLRGRGKQSGVETGWDVWHLWTIQDGTVVRGRGFRTREEALEAAGLSE